LLFKVVDALKKEGIVKVGLTVYSDNEPGNVFWEKNGFLERIDLVYRDKILDSRNERSL
jgi:ribosomal protein S18 acetylase RimI-like enzyme